MKKLIQQNGNHLMRKKETILTQPDPEFALYLSSFEFLHICEIVGISQTH